MANVYLLEQEDTEQLFGDFMSSAVVIASSVGEAQKILMGHLRQFARETGESVECYANRLCTTKIGNNGQVPKTHVNPVVCLMIGYNAERTKRE